MASCHLLFERFCATRAAASVASEEGVIGRVVPDGAVDDGHEGRVVERAGAGPDAVAADHHVLQREIDEASRVYAAVTALNGQIGDGDRRPRIGIELEIEHGVERSRDAGAVNDRLFGSSALNQQPLVVGRGSMETFS